MTKQNNKKYKNVKMDDIESVCRRTVNALRFPMSGRKVHLGGLVLMVDCTTWHDFARCGEFYESDQGGKRDCVDHTPLKFIFFNSAMRSKNRNQVQKIEKNLIE